MDYIILIVICVVSFAGGAFVGSEFTWMWIRRQQRQRERDTTLAAIDMERINK